MFLKALSPRTVISGVLASISEFGLTYNIVHDNKQTAMSILRLATCLFSFVVVVPSLIMSDSLWPYELQPTRFPCHSPSPRACSNSCPCPLNQGCHPTILSSVVPFSFCPQSFQASESFRMSQFFTWGGQSIGASALASVLPMNIWGWFTLGLTGLISL